MTDGYKIKRVLTWVNEVRLPAEYQEVEYIQSSGTQWIDTGVTPTQNTKSQLKFMNLETTGELIYGIYTGSDSTDYRLFNASGTMYFDFSSSRISGSTIAINTVYELELGNYYVKNVGEPGSIISGTSISSYTGGRTITLNNYNNSIYSKNRWYYVKIWNGDTQVRDLVPCYRKSDSVIGMYDTINDVFYTNSGTGIFTKGNDVPSFVEKQIYPVENGIVFDFKNNGLSGCTLSDTTYASIVAGEGISMSGTTNYNYGTEVKLPSSVYGKAIKQVILNCYYPTSGYGAGKGFGCIKNGSYGFRYSREEYEQNNIGFSDGQTTAQNIGLMTGEITITMNFGDGVISGTVNNTSFSVSNSAANTIRDSFIDGTFRLLMVSWRTSSISYLRKATIITE